MYVGVVEVAKNLLAIWITSKDAAGLKIKTQNGKLLVFPSRYKIVLKRADMLVYYDGPGQHGNIAVKTRNCD
ncbi:MAG: hypothetical protein CVU20_05110 [Betaproteobacteria bacterium HGW-Betaproteobacteria-14]|nr:MAG: hypothetical protein CVU20_05110 [Betaproteobacteria bacterium HGW-Betaproteobacteria-14]